MNISSIVIRTLPEHSQKMVEVFKKSELCEYYLHDETKIIVAIEGEVISEEMAKLKKLQKMDHVIAADMMYSYSEDELEKEKDKIEKSGDVNQWLNDSSENAGLIRYAGDLKKKM